MKREKCLVYGRELHGHCRIMKERLKGTDIDLRDFVFSPGGNVYVFSYEKEGSRRHTFIDSGDRRYRDKMFPLLMENGIDPADIERIIITHRHLDHCGLTEMLARESGAKIVVHPRYRDFVEGNVREEERWWLRGFDPTRLKHYDIEYLAPQRGVEMRNIGGIDFPPLGGTFDLGEGARLEILACPESDNKHTDDQLIVLYSPSGQLRDRAITANGFRPADDVIFAGDLWLMQGPFYESSPIRNIPHALRFMRYRIRSRMSGYPIPRVSIREQDEAAKEALKTGFNLIRVKPGHGDEFLGSRIIPQGLLANRDLLVKLGYAINGDESILKKNDNESKVEALKEKAYLTFTEELLTWGKWGYNAEEISGLLVRIHREQRGGRGSIKKDRKERRALLRATLVRLRDDMDGPDKLRRIAELTLLQI